MGYPPTALSFFKGTDMVKVQWTSADATCNDGICMQRVFTPMAFTCMMVGLSTLINGGMVQECVLKRPHPNFHWTVVVYTLAILVLHFYNMRLVSRRFAHLSTSHGRSSCCCTCIRL